MKIAVLGGLGAQGRGALCDLSRSEAVTQIICADQGTQLTGPIQSQLDLDKIQFVAVDATSKDAIEQVIRDVDVVVELLPAPLMENAFEAALAVGVSIVSTNYYHQSPTLDERARAAGIVIMPECGLDPGIDLIIFGHAVKQFDELHLLNSYCGGIPEARASNNPLRYKVSWNWDMVLMTQKRESFFIQNGSRVQIPWKKQHDNELIHQIDFPGVGALEAIPNGDAVFYADLLHVTQSIRETGRYSLRWPGWCDFWRPLKALGFLDETPIAGLDVQLTPLQFLSKLIGPQIQYRDDEKDLAVMYNVFEGLQDGRKKRLVSSLMIERDLQTGLFAMSMGVGFTASIVAQMIGIGQIAGKGLLSPSTDVPYETFMAELSQRGMAVSEKTFFLDR
ncbi:MAG: saccharopine dehydrogenase C-terminal domain-containing protein [Syntrophobacteraceae bacterium]